MSKLIKDIMTQKTFKAFTENTINEGVEMFFILTNDNIKYKLTKENNVCRISKSIIGKGIVIKEYKYDLAIKHVLNNI
jgi:hypothetical protein